MKKFLFILTIAVLLLAIPCGSYAEDLRLCPNCGAEATGNYCSDCGHACGASLPKLGANEAYLTLKVVYEKNIVFAKYDVDLRLDGSLIGTVKQDETLEKVIAVKQGVHEITLQKGEKIMRNILIDVKKCSLFSCTLKAHTTYLELMDGINSSPASSEAALAYRINKEYGLCANVDYKRVCRYPEEFQSQPMHLSGVVVSASESLMGTTSAVIQDKQNNLWLVQYKRHDDDPRLLLNDSIDVYGHYKGVNKHQFSSTWLQLPTVEMEYLRIQ